MLAKVNRLFAGALLALLLPAVAVAADYRAGEQYSRLDKPVASAPAVVEFFSFIAALVISLPKPTMWAAPSARRCLRAPS